ncbi:MAG: glutamine-hydrolyzing carbamoyl-phosphate synthase small subunit [Mailhella sp.]|nr:glutamine-hydrolyzing carbamoyl-phosphate synthase small subunit [Mailhella sp.]
MKALLTLEDGFSLEGESFTGPIELAGGEVIFNTAMCGYQELLTDPSYTGQMVCLTYPLIGNYGITAEDMESDRVHVSALIVRECCKEPSNWRSVESLPDFLKRHGVPGIEGIDTRALTLHLRKNGAMRGCISTSVTVAEDLAAKARSLPPMEGQDLVSRVAPLRPYRRDEAAGRPAGVQIEADGSYAWPEGHSLHVLVYDFGIKWNILRSLSARDMELLVVPPSFTCEQVKAAAPDAVFLSNGPGDPAALKPVIREIAGLVDLYPIGAICLGHQLLGHALGGRTEKLKFGHHGVNHPIKNLLTGHIEVSSQNHGFCVIPPEGVQKVYVNLNDGTLEGFRDRDRPILTVQHHPEAAAGPRECRTFFDDFRGMVCGEKAAREKGRERPQDRTS